MAIMNVTKNVKNQFSNDKNLAMRINFYKKYTTNKYKFADWLFDKYVFKNWNFAGWLEFSIIRFFRRYVRFS